MQQHHVKVWCLHCREFQIFAMNSAQSREKFSIKEKIGALTAIKAIVFFPPSPKLLKVLGPIHQIYLFEKENSYLSARRPQNHRTPTLIHQIIRFGMLTGIEEEATPLNFLCDEHHTPQAFLAVKFWSPSEIALSSCRRKRQSIAFGKRWGGTFPLFTLTYNQASGIILRLTAPFGAYFKKD